LVNEVAILGNLAKLQNFVSNGLLTEFAIFRNLPSILSARVYIRARIRVAIAKKTGSDGCLPARVKFPRRKKPATSSSS
jgi:hypothetical protein